MKISCIYKIVSLSHPDRIYIGSAIDFLGRKKNHLVPLRMKRHANNILQHHFNKYGIQDLKFEIVERIYNKEELVSREQFYIDLYNPYFNICKVAGLVTGKKHSEETKEKIRQANLGRKYPPVTEETRKKLSAFQLSRPPRTAETREKLRLAHIGKPFILTEEQKLKNRLALKGKKRSEEFKKHLSDLRKGVKRKPEHVAKSVEARRINQLLKKSA